MAYLGQSNSLYDPTRVTPTTVQTFNGDGITTQFTLQYSILQSIDIEVLVENVFQQPDYAYTAIGNVVTFTSPPPVGTNNIYVRFGKVTGLTGTVPDGSVTSSKLANNIRLLATDMYTGTGSQTAFNLSDTPADANSLIVTVNGVGQAAPSNYTVSGSTITFTAAPSSGANVVIRNVGFRTTQTLFAFPSGTQMVQPVITGGSANNMTLTNATITGGSANGIMYVNSSNTVTSGSGLVFDGTNVGIGTSSPGAKLEVNGNQIINYSGQSQSLLTVGGGSTSAAMNFRGSIGSAYAWQISSNSFVNSALEFTRSTSVGGTTFSTPSMMLDSSGNLGVGTTSPTTAITIFRSSVSGNDVDMPFVQLKNTNASQGNGSSSFNQATVLLSAGNGSCSGSVRACYDSSGSYGTGIQLAVNGTNPLQFYTNGSERARIDSSGNLLVGTTSATSLGGVSWKTVISGTANVLAVANPGTGGATTAAFQASNFSGSGVNVINFYNGSGTFAGSISIPSNGSTGTTTAYNTSSDQRLKENIVDAPIALSSVKAIKVRSFDWRSDGSHVDYGYIAQELLEVVPEAVHVPADPEEMMGVDFGKLTPRLVKAIQELSAKVDSLQSELTQLKSTK